MGIINYLDTHYGEMACLCQLIELHNHSKFKNDCAALLNFGIISQFMWTDALTTLIILASM
ncbi:hypothetical protein HMPREF9104_00974 [Lentilactobacillus kisonensis F0435]|uniref:Uncharacterized protein n=1 Tax=Lentilactobacillus kisonensis F0435 TaxID=797516 RepID=H1LEE8_9LACO|nr:hypothetical protein HMPREF9104_00974 [Lentilactobacillus kisonensis F0435]